jgi:hypothetical protein
VDTHGTDVIGAANVEEGSDAVAPNQWPVVLTAVEGSALKVDMHDRCDAELVAAGSGQIAPELVVVRSCSSVIRRSALM